MRLRTPVHNALMFHANYREPGGEERSFDAECEAFAERGFDVHRFTVNNSDHPLGARGAALAIFNTKVFLEALRAFRQLRPRVAYVNNTWPGLSSSVLLAARIAGVPTIQALRNYRLVAPSAKLMDDGACLYCGAHSGPWSCIRKRCAPGGTGLIVYLASLSVRLVTLGWRKHLFVTPSRVSRRILQNRGLRRRPVAVRPNFIDEQRPPTLSPGRDVAFVGRLSREKGILELARAWPDQPSFAGLTIIGGGELMHTLVRVAETNPNVIVCGPMPPARVLQVMRSSIACVVPSVWAEPFGRVAIESMSVGTPAIVLGNGALVDIVGPQGIVMEEISAHAIRRAVRLAQEPAGGDRRFLAHQRFLRSFSAEASRTSLTVLLRILEMRAR